jgi:hypothetical protein
VHHHPTPTAPQPGAPSPNALSLVVLSLIQAPPGQSSLQVTGLPSGTLIERPDCSSNCYARGGHLLCHDDVISTRRVSYIVYLTDPDEEWLKADGGALELFPLINDCPGASISHSC